MNIRRDRTATVASPDSMLEHGTDTGHGNLLGIQPFMVPGDYASAASFSAGIDAYLRAAAERDWLRAKTIVALPEHLGTWLVAVGEGRGVLEAATVQQAMARLVMRHPSRFATSWLRTRAGDRLRAALFRMKAGQMAGTYHAVFSALACRYRVTLVAGSIVLPTPAIVDGYLSPGDGPLQNVSVVYRPDGTPHRVIVRKVFPTEEELPFTAPAPVEELPVFDTPAGRLGVLICADSWRPAVYQRLSAQRPDLVIVPSHLATTDVWDQAWQGYNGAPPPSDVHPGDVRRLTEGEAWLKYALPGRMATSGARCGVNIFLHGKLWDLGADGRTLVVRDGDVWQAPHVDGAITVNCWLPQP